MSTQKVGEVQRHLCDFTSSIEELPKLVISATVHFEFEYLSPPHPRLMRVSVWYLQLRLESPGIL